MGKNILTKELLLKSVAEWNAVRRTNPDLKPDLYYAYLHGKDLRGVDFRGADLRCTDLSEADLRWADLSEADIRGAYLCQVNLSEANLNRADFSHTTFKRGADGVLGGISKDRIVGTDLTKANLHKAFIPGANLSEAHLRGADLSNSVLSGTKLSGVNFVDADLNGADLHGAELQGAILIRTKLMEANLSWSELKGAILSEANLSGAVVDNTTFGAVDLSNVIGLETVKHDGPSTIGIDTIYASNGNIPEVFLRGCGVPNTFIEYVHSLTVKPIDYYSCFISYSHKNEEFAKRLHTDLQANNVRCWFAPHDLPIGAKTRPAIDDAIRIHDKLLLILSEHSVQSNWVEHEVEHALDLETERGELVLFPVRLDDAVMDSKTGWASNVKRQRNIGDFTRWKDHDSYQKAFSRLLRDLKQ